MHVHCDIKPVFLLAIAVCSLTSSRTSGQPQVNSATVSESHTVVSAPGKFDITSCRGTYIL
jgi:hypothetical protein